MSLRDEGWKARGLCREVDPDLWYPEQGESPRIAKRICQDCQVRPECLQESLANEEQFGVWGGLSARDRRKLLKRRLAA